MPTSPGCWTVGDREKASDEVSNGNALDHEHAASGAARIPHFLGLASPRRLTTRLSPGRQAPPCQLPDVEVLFPDA